MTDTSTDAVEALIATAEQTDRINRACAAEPNPMWAPFVAALRALVAERDGLKHLRDIDGRSFDKVLARAEKAEAERDAARARGEMLAEAVRLRQNTWYAWMKSSEEGRYDRVQRMAEHNASLKALDEAIAAWDAVESDHAAPASSGAPEVSE